MYFPKESEIQFEGQHCVSLMNKETKKPQVSSAALDFWSVSSTLTHQVVLDALNELLGFILVPLEGVHGGVEPVLQVFGPVFGFQRRPLGIIDLTQQ